MAYQQHDKNSCCLSSLDSYFKALNGLVNANASATHISALLTHGVHAYSDRIKFANSIIVDKVRNFGEQHIRYKL